MPYKAANARADMSSAIFRHLRAPAARTVSFECSDGFFGNRLEPYVLELEPDAEVRD